ncbi:MAG TPA: glycosyltransferase [Phycisphaerae bacterium]|nr:glycosyltransferase [Phycisphaerae bacterium]HPS53792.1 glycosyltransferase [Phycisphaerae bacterium]
MTPTILAILAALPSLIWISRHFRISRERKHGFVLTPEYAGPPSPRPKISVIVAAKEEEENIRSCLETLAAQDYGDFEIIAVNDRSTDATGKIIDDFAAAHPNVKAVHIKNLPDGWKGKNHAIHTAIPQATGEYFLFTDADCKMTSSRTLSVAMQLLKDHNVGMLSVLPNLDTKSFWEDVIQPVCSAVLMLWFEPAKVNNPKKAVAYANGAFMLVSRHAYDIIGGHAAIKNDIQEDMTMARHIKENHQGLFVTRNSGLYSVRMYRSLPEIINGWTRIFYGSFRKLTRVLTTMFLLTFASVLPPAMVIIALLAYLGDPTHWLPCVITALASTSLEISVIYRYHKICGANKYLACMYPIGCLILDYILIRSSLKHRRGATIAWKNTSYTQK